MEDLEGEGTTLNSFGFIFNVRTRPGTGVVLVNGLEFYTESTAYQKFELWTRLGSFKDHKGYYERWERIASGTVRGSGMGKYTAIPEDAFTPVSIPGGGGEGGTRAFYLTLKENQLVYKKGGGMTEVGTAASDVAIQHSNDELEIWEGESVLTYPFHTVSEIIVGASDALRIRLLLFRMLRLNPSNPFRYLLYTPRSRTGRIRIASRAPSSARFTTTGCPASPSAPTASSPNCPARWCPPARPSSRSLRSLP